MTCKIVPRWKQPLEFINNYWLSLCFWLLCKPLCNWNGLHYFVIQMTHDLIFYLYLASGIKNCNSTRKKNTKLVFRLLFKHSFYPYHSISYLNVFFVLSFETIFVLRTAFWVVFWFYSQRYPWAILDLLYSN